MPVKYLGPKYDKKKLYKINLHNFSLISYSLPKDNIYIYIYILQPIVSVMFSGSA